MCQKVYSADIRDIVYDSSKDFIDTLIDQEISRLNSLGVSIDAPESLTPSTQKAGTLGDPEYCVEYQKIFKQYVEKVKEKGFSDQSYPDDQSNPSLRYALMWFDEFNFYRPKRKH